MNKFDLVEVIKKETTKIKNEVGSFNLLLSGGVDSSTLAAIEKPDRVFTVKLPYGPMHDEFEDVMKVVKHFKLEDRLTVIELNEDEFDLCMKEAVKAIGRPIPHYNIFPLFVMFRKIAGMGIKDVVCGDGPDESMVGYARQLIMNYLYKVRDFKAFEQYQGVIDKVLIDPSLMYSILTGKPWEKVRSIMNGKSLVDGMCAVDMELMRPDMDDMTNKIAEYFGITIHRPYQTETCDNLMFNLPEEQKIKDFEYGKALLREVAEIFLPKEIAWRKQKIGGPLVPVNKIKGWNLDPFDKSMYMKYQEDILSE
jgi:asparagine synthetase B (glutamine-hydrolysing)